MTTRLIALSLVATVCSACLSATAPVATSPSNNSNIEVQTLFTHDGCTVFRFFDAGYHYYARCDGAHASVATMSNVTCGRHCVRQEEVKTVPADDATSKGTEREQQ
jgi:hypothetical protein